MWVKSRWIVWLVLALGALGCGSDREVDSPERYRLGAGPWEVGKVYGLPITGEQKALAPLDPEKLASFVDPQRDLEQKPAEVIAALGLRAGHTVADIGAGSGYFSWRFAEVVGPTGRVWATDISYDAMEYMQRRLLSQPLSNLYLLLHPETDLLLPDGALDVAFLCDVHYFYYPRATHSDRTPLERVLGFYRNVRRAMKPGGTLGIIERSEKIYDPDPHRGNISADEIIDQMQQAGFVLKARHDFLAHQNFVVFDRGL